MTNMGPISLKPFDPRDGLSVVVPADISWGDIYITKHINKKKYILILKNHVITCGGDEGQTGLNKYLSGAV